MRPISIIVPVLNEADNIVKCLNSLVKLDYPKYEIIVIDGGSTDGTIEKIKKFKKVRLLNNPKKFTSAGKNIGIRAAKYNLIAMVDADAHVQKNWLSVLERGLTKDVVGVGGANIAPNDNNEFRKAICKAQSTFLGSMGSVQGKRFTKEEYVSSISHCNALYQKEPLIEVGLFPEDGQDLAEDWEINLLLRKKGDKLKVIPKSFVWHNFRADPTRFAKNMYRYGLGRGRLNRKYPEDIRPIYLLPYLFLISLFVSIWVIVLYLVGITCYSRLLDKKSWGMILQVFIIQHFLYSIGETVGLFTTKIRL